MPPKEIPKIHGKRLSVVNYLRTGSPEFIEFSKKIKDDPLFKKWDKSTNNNATYHCLNIASNIMQSKPVKGVVADKDTQLKLLQVFRENGYFILPSGKRGNSYYSTKNREINDASLKQMEYIIEAFKEAREKAQQGAPAHAPDDDEDEYDDDDEDEDGNPSVSSNPDGPARAVAQIQLGEQMRILEDIGMSIEEVKKMKEEFAEVEQELFTTKAQLKDYEAVLNELSEQGKQAGEEWQKKYDEIQAKYDKLHADATHMKEQYKADLDEKERIRADASQMKAEYAGVLDENERMRVYIESYSHANPPPAGNGTPQSDQFGSVYSEGGLEMESEQTQPKGQETQTATQPAQAPAQAPAQVPAGTAPAGAGAGAPPPPPPPNPAVNNNVAQVKVKEEEEEKANPVVQLIAGVKEKTIDEAEAKLRDEQASKRQAQLGYNSRVNWFGEEVNWAGILQQLDSFSWKQQDPWATTIPPWTHKQLEAIDPFL
jgi:hypothetical protein